MQLVLVANLNRDLAKSNIAENDRPLQSGTLSDRIGTLSATLKWCYLTWANAVEVKIQMGII